MRIDKFLKSSRLIKRREVAKELALHTRITINGKTAKPSSLVKIGDVVTVLFGTKETTIKVLSLEIKKNAIPQFELIKD